MSLGFVVCHFRRRWPEYLPRGDAVSYLSYTVCQYLRLTSRSFQFPGTYYVFDLLKTKLLSNEILILEVELSYEFI